jgi:signal transduction histidine kinase
MRTAILGSVRGKQLAIIVGTTAAASLVAGIAMLILNLIDYHNTWVRDIFTQMELLGRSSTAALEFGDPKVAHENLALLSLRPEFRDAAIYDARGKLFAAYVRRGDRADFPPLPADEGFSTDMGTITAFKRIIDAGQILGTVYVKADYKLAANLVRDFSLVLAVTVAALLAAILASRRLQSFLVTPILAIANTARAVTARRDFSLRAEKMSNDEVGVLAEAFNDMLAEIESRTDQLEESNIAQAKEVAERRRVEEEVRRLNKELDSRVQQRTEQLEFANRELESFTSSVSHDLRAPLRAIDGFSHALEEDYGADLPPGARRDLDRIRQAAQRMGQLIEDLLNLSRLSRADMHPQRLDISAMATDIIAELRQGSPGREVDVSIWDNLSAEGDPRLVRVVLENLLGNAWKYTGKTAHPRIEVGATHQDGKVVFFVRDNGAGFNMEYADKLFVPFQRLHHPDEFEGTGVGLATVQRIVQRHGGRIWAHGTPGKGAVFFFTLEEEGQAPAPETGG